MVNTLCFVPLSTINVPSSPVLCRVPEAQLKSIVWQTLQAVNFCHKHNVSIIFILLFHLKFSETCHVVPCCLVPQLLITLVI